MKMSQKTRQTKQKKADARVNGLIQFSLREITSNKNQQSKD
jgi:hypothetical protein